jgi:hypothetical protein
MSALEYALVMGVFSLAAVAVDALLLRGRP